MERSKKRFSRVLRLAVLLALAGSLSGCAVYATPAPAYYAGHPYAYPSPAVMYAPGGGWHHGGGFWR